MLKTYSNMLKKNYEKHSPTYYPLPAGSEKHIQFLFFSNRSLREGRMLMELP